MSVEDLARPCILECAPYVAGKPIEAVRRLLGLEDVIKLASNENPLGPSPKAMRAVAAMAPKMQYYPDDASTAVKEALAARWDLTSRHFICGNASMQLLELACKTLLNEDDEVVVGDPAFRVFGGLVRSAGGRLAPVPLKDHVHDLAAMLAAVTSRTKIVIVCNPNNPTGTVVDREALLAFLGKVPDTAVTILDEAYADYVEAPYPDPRDSIKAGPNVLVLRSFSKIYGLAGLRFGYGLAKPGLIDLLERARMPFPVNSLAQAAAIAALEDEEFRLRSVRENKAGKALMYRHLSAMGLGYILTEANFVAVRVGGDDRVIFEALLKEGVIVFAGANTGLPGYLRITVGTPPHIERCMEALGRVVTRLHWATPSLK